MAKRHHQQKKRKKKIKNKTRSNNNQESQTPVDVETSSSFDVSAAQFSTTGEGNNKSDIISNLPNDTLQHIVSLLPLTSAAQTMLISSQWRQIWNVVSLKTGSVEDMVPVTSTFLASVNWVNPLTRPWKLQFHTQDDRIRMVAITGANNKLHMEFSGVEGENNHQQNYESLRRRFYLELDLNDDDLDMTSCLHLPFPTTTTTSFHVKSLYLTGVNQLSSETVSSLVSNLHFLEKIEIRECDSMFGMSVSGGSRLKHLSIIDCGKLESLTLLAHSLTSLRFRGAFPEIFMVGLSTLEDVMLDFREGPGYDDYLCLESHALLLLFLREAHHITLCQWNFQVMIKPKLHLKDSDAQFNNLKELWWFDNSMEEDHIDHLISFIGACPAIEKLFITIDPTSYSLPTNKLTGGSITSHNRKTRLGNLKLVKMEGFQSHEEELLLADRVLEIAARDVIIMAMSPHSHPRSLVKIHPNRRKYVEEIDNRLINTKHIHMSV